MMKSHCEKELLIYFLVLTAPTSLGLGGLLNRIAKCLKKVYLSSLKIVWLNVG